LKAYHGFSGTAQAGKNSIYFFITVRTSHRST
jgi:hypothetical protein